MRTDWKKCENNERLMGFRNGLKAHSSNKWIIGFLLRIFYHKIEALGISDILMRKKVEKKCIK